MIPKLFHFIWAGGIKTMPMTSIRTVAKWAQEHPEHEIYLWVDSKTWPFPQPLKEYYQETFQQLGLSKKIRSRIQLKDIGENLFQPASDEKIKSTEAYVRYEIDRLRPNYGASSDLLRYAILYEYGGAYFDTDIDPGTNKIPEETSSASPWWRRTQSSRSPKDRTDHILYVDPDSQNTGNVGNDALIASEKNPIIGKILELAKRHYAFMTHAITPEGAEPAPIDGVPNLLSEDFLQKMSYLTQRLTALYNYDSSWWISDTTPSQTGPRCVARYVTNSINDLLTEAQGVKIQSIPSESRTPYKVNTFQWADRSIICYGQERENEAFEAIFQTIQFETEKMHILRIYDHIENLIEATQCPSGNIDQLLPRFFRELQKRFPDPRTFDQIAHIQYTGRYEAFLQHHFLDFYRNAPYRNSYPPQEELQILGINLASVTMRNLKRTNPDLYSQNICTRLLSILDRANTYLAGQSMDFSLPKGIDPSTAKNFADLLSQDFLEKVIQKISGGDDRKNYYQKVVGELREKIRSLPTSQPIHPHRLMP